MPLPIKGEKILGEGFTPHSYLPRKGGDDFYLSLDGRGQVRVKSLIFVSFTPLLSLHRGGAR